MNKETIEDLIIGALEGGSNYWYYLPDISMVELRKGFALSENIIHSAYQGAKIPVSDVEAGHDGEYLGYITKEGINKAVELFHNEHPSHYADAISENHDAINSDVFFQLVVLGEVIYG